MISAQDIMDIISLPDDEQNVVLSLVRSFKGNKKNRNQERNSEIESPFILLTEGKILSDLEVSRRQAEKGEGKDAKEALTELGRKYGFIEV